MTDSPVRSGPSLDLIDLAHCCAEAQADGVPCPTLGRDCEICERAVRNIDREGPLPPIRPVGRD